MNASLRPRGRDQVEHRLDVHRRTVPSPHGEAAARRHGARERRARARPDRVGRCRPRAGRLDPVGLRPQAAVRAEHVTHAVRPRPAPARRGVRRAARRPPGPARGPLPVRAAARRRRRRRRSSRGGHGPPLARSACPLARRSPRSPRSRRPRSRCEAASWPRTTAPSTSRSGPTRRASRRRRSTTAAAATSSARCC